MACLIFGNSEIVLSLWCHICLRKPDQDFLETLHGLFKAVKVEFSLALAEDDLSDKILRGQISDKTVVFFPVGIQDDDRRGPLDGIAFHQSLVFVEINLKGYKIILYRETDIGIGVSNSCQLLAANSEIIIKVHQDKLLFFLCLCLGCGERSLPLNLFSHIEPSFQ
jgi:hypothetical protein